MYPARSGQKPKERTGPHRGGPGGVKPHARFRRKPCRFCTHHEEIDYKNMSLLRNFVTERGKILPRRITGNCARHQRVVVRAVKRARLISLLPFTTA